MTLTINTEWCPNNALTNSLGVELAPRGNVGTLLILICLVVLVALMCVTFVTSHQSLISDGYIGLTIVPSRAANNKPGVLM